MPKIRPSPPVCPNCHRGMKLMLVKETGHRELRCVDCGHPDPLQSDVTQAWLKGELGSVKQSRLNARHCEELFRAMAE
jgi:Zn ribbon nucleic-acid-binding protein